MLGLKVNVELDNTKKLELGIAALVLCVVGFVVYLNWGYWSGKQIDTTIASWVEVHKVGTDASKPISVQNPENPAKRLRVTVFANNDGKVEITEGDNEDGPKKYTIRFTRDARRTAFLKTWRDQVDQIESMKDPVRRVIAYYGVGEQREGRWMVSSAGLTSDQRATEREARTNLKQDLAYIDECATDGSFETKYFEKFVNALAAYRANDNDAAKDPKKRALANAVMEASREYLGKVQDGKMAAIEKYVDTVNKLLDTDQRAKILDAATRFYAARTRAVAKTG